MTATGWQYVSHQDAGGCQHDKTDKGRCINKKIQLVAFHVDAPSFETPVFMNSRRIHQCEPESGIGFLDDFFQGIDIRLCVAIS